MAIIYSYPEKTTPAGGDFLVITDSQQPYPNKNRTKSLTIDNLASYVITSQSAITGSGTIDTIPIFTGPNTIGDSFMTYNPTSQFFTISKRLLVSSDLVVNGRGAFQGLYLRADCPLQVKSVLQDGNNSPGTAGQVLSSTGTGVEWTDNTATGTVTGTGTTNTLPIWSDGPNSVLSDSGITQSSPEIIKIGTGIAGGASVLETNLLTCNIISGANLLTIQGNSIIGNEATDILQIGASVSDYTGTASTAAGQVLVSNASSQLEWKSIGVQDIKVTITDSQIQTLGTVPVEILPAVANKIYQIIGLTTQNIGNAGLTDSYDWSASGDGVFYGQGFTSTQHRVEIPNSILPQGGASFAPSAYVATPVSGSWKAAASVKVSTTTGVDPTIVNSPSAEMVVNVTYRLIDLA
jgi:hypothetical protein